MYKPKAWSRPCSVPFLLVEAGLPWGTGEAMVQQLLQKLHTSMSRALKGKANQCLLHGSKKTENLLTSGDCKWNIGWLIPRATKRETYVWVSFSHSDWAELAWWCAHGLKMQEAEFVASLTSQAPKLTMEQVWQALEVNVAKFFWKGNSCDTVEEKQAQGLVSFWLHPCLHTKSFFIQKSLSSQTYHYLAPA